MQVRWGMSMSTPSNGVWQGGILSLLLFNLYMDHLSKELKECRTGCLVGDSLINHVLYADDLVVLSPSSAGLQQLLRICSQNGIMYDIKFNSTKSMVLMAITKEDRKLSFFLTGR